MLMAMTGEAFMEIYVKDWPKRMRPYIYNYDSMLQMPGIDMDSLKAIFPFNENLQCLMSTDDREFDIRYAEYLMSQEPFGEMVNMMLLLYNGIDVIILIGRDQESFSKQVLESYFKFIQQRYGVNVQYVYSKDDIDWSKNQQVFSFNGLFFLDQDKQQLIPKMFEDIINSGMYKQTLKELEESETRL